MTSNFRMIKPRCISSQNSRHCEIDVSNCWNELYRDTSWLPCSKYQILNQTNVWAIHFDKSCWFVKNWNGVNVFNLFVFLLRLWKIVWNSEVLKREYNVQIPITHSINCESVLVTAINPILSPKYLRCRETAQRANELKRRVKGNRLILELSINFRRIRIWRQCDRVARARWSCNLLVPGSDPHHATLWIFFRLPSVQLCGCALFIANLNYFSISYNVLPLLDTFVVDWKVEVEWRTTCLGSINIA